MPLKVILGSNIYRFTLLLCRIHSKRIEKSSGNSDTRSNDRTSAHRGLECNNRSNDDHNTLDGVTDSMGDRVDLKQKSRLIRF